MRLASLARGNAAHRILLVVLVFGVLGSIYRLRPNVQRCAAPRVGTGAFIDFRLFQYVAKNVHVTGRIYATEDSTYFSPASGVYKYPPTYIALIQPLRDVKWRQAVPVVFWVNVAFLLAGLGLLLWMVRASWARGLLLCIVFLNWSPFWESFEGMQLELAMAAFLFAMFLLCHRGRFFSGGAALGLATSLKVYPIAILWYVLARPIWRRRMLAGAVLGTALPILASTFVVPWRNLVEYARILPRLGAVSLFPDNLGIPGQCARLVMGLLYRSESTPQKVVQSIQRADLAVVASPAMQWAARLLAYVLSGLLIAGVAVLVRRCLRASAGDPSELRTREVLGLAVAICLLLLILPTSWPDYQTLLIVPLLTGLGWARAPRRSPWPWVLLLAAAIAGGLQIDEEWLRRDRNLLPLLRAWIPLAIAGAALIRMRDGGTDCPTARTSPAPSVSPGGTPRARS